MREKFFIFTLLLTTPSLWASNCRTLSPKLADYLPAKSIKKCHSIEEGLSFDQIYALDITQNGEKKKVAVKVLNPLRHLQNRKTIIRVSQLIGQEKWGPEILWHSENELIFVMDFLKGKSMTTLEGNEKKMGKALREIHELLIKDNLGPIVQRYSMYDRSKKRLGELVQLKLLSEAQHTAIEKYLEGLKPTLDETHKIIIHNDLKPSNIFDVNGEFLFLDWAETSVASIYDELGSLSFYFDLSDFQEKELLTGYFGPPPRAIDLKYLDIHKNLTALHFGLWTLRMGNKPLDAVVLPTAQEYAALQKSLLDQNSKTTSPTTFQKVGAFLLSNFQKMQPGKNLAN
ncbi:MAG: aminoglycoside phosphotransferase family protein [Alphaproteobacteria bacterium]